MTKSQLDANTYGVGELITQRKRFVVPEHQRNFAWQLEQIEDYLNDVANAFERGADDYFIGLIVLQGPINGAWHILDGQQRLATTTMIFSAIRDWFLRNGLKADAQQIEREFIGVRELGGKYSPRLRLNTDDQNVFQHFIVEAKNTADLQTALTSSPRGSSGFLLLGGALLCRRWIDKYADQASRSLPDSPLFGLSSYFETKVKTVCVDVSSETDAYILFESLNDRGIDLSALDLIKNYVFSEIQPSPHDNTLADWRHMTENIEGKDADDFLKVFWTSKFGVIQKLDLFNRVRAEYPGKEGATRLVRELAEASERFEAIDDPDHELWVPFGSICRQHIKDLKILGSRQSRALILGAMTYLRTTEIAPFLWLLVVIIVRYQLIGRGRTGIMEKEFSFMARSIHDGRVTTAEDAATALANLLPSNDEFERAFAEHAEAKSSRVEYLLLELEAAARQKKGHFDWSDYVKLRSAATQVSPRYVIPRSYAETVDDELLFQLLGNRVLVEYSVDTDGEPAEFRSKLAESQFLLTRDVARPKQWNIDTILRRSAHLARLAVTVWRVDNRLLNPKRPTAE